MRSRDRRRICRTGFIVFWLLFIHQIGNWNGQESSLSWKWLGVQKTFAFDADAESGPNRNPEGATTIRQTRDSRWVIYDRQDQTDWLKVSPPETADQQVTVVFDFLRLVGSVGVEVYGSNPYAPPLEQVAIDEVQAYNYRLTVLQEHYFKVYAKAEGAIAKYTFQYALTPIPPSATPLATPSVTPPPTPTIAPTATPTGTPPPTPTIAPTATPTVTPPPTPTIAPTATPSVTPPPTPTIAPTATPSVTPSVTVSPTPPPSPLPTATPTTPPTPTATPTVSLTPTATLTPGPTASPTMSPTPTRPSVMPTLSPTMTPTIAVTVTPTPQPAGTALPALFATLTPSPRPSPTPTASPSASPTSVPQLKVTVPPTTTAVPQLPGTQEFNWWLLGGLLLCVLIILALLVLVVLLKKRQSSSNTELPTITAAEFRLLASLAADQHKVRLAEKCYRKATELEPYNTDTYYELGVFFYQTDQCKEAITAFKRYLTGKIIQPEAYFYLASCYVRLRQYDAAEEFFTKALQLKPDDALTYVGLGEAAQGRGNRQQAEQYYEQALALDPDCQEARQHLNHLG